MTVVTLALGAAVWLPATALAAPPVLTSVGHIDGHPTATWTLPPGVETNNLEIATSPVTPRGLPGFFLDENVRVFTNPEATQTSYVSVHQLDPGTYYVHVTGQDRPCFFAGRCPYIEFSQIMTFVIEPPPPPPPPPRYQASVRTTHPKFLPPEGSWTYVGDTVRARFRNANARPSDARRYTVCNTTATRRLACRSRTIVGRSWGEFRLRMTMPMLTRWHQHVDFTWRIDGRVVARKRIKFHGE